MFKSCVLNLWTLCAVLSMGLALPVSGRAEDTALDQRVNQELLARKSYLEMVERSVYQNHLANELSKKERLIAENRGEIDKLKSRDLPDEAQRVKNAKEIEFFVQANERHEKIRARIEIELAELAKKGPTDLEEASRQIQKVLSLPVTVTCTDEIREIIELIAQINHSYAQIYAALGRIGSQSAQEDSGLSVAHDLNRARDAKVASIEKFKTNMGKDDFDLFIGRMNLEDDEKALGDAPNEERYAADRAVKSDLAWLNLYKKNRDQRQREVEDSYLELSDLTWSILSLRAIQPNSHSCQAVSDSKESQKAKTGVPESTHPDHSNVSQATVLEGK